MITTTPLLSQSRALSLDFLLPRPRQVRGFVTGDNYVVRTYIKTTRRTFHEQFGAIWKNILALGNGMGVGI